MDIAQNSPVSATDNVSGSSDNGQIFAGPTIVPSAKVLPVIVQPMVPESTGAIPSDTNLNISRPVAGTVSVIETSGRSELNFEFNTSEVHIAAIDVDLVMIFSDNSKIILPNLALGLLSGNPPKIIFQGRVLSPQDVLGGITEVSLADAAPSVHLASPDFLPKKPSGSTPGDNNANTGKDGTASGEPPEPPQPIMSGAKTPKTADNEGKVTQYDSPPVKEVVPGSVASGPGITSPNPSVVSDKPKPVNLSQTPMNANILIDSNVEGRLLQTVGVTTQGTTIRGASGTSPADTDSSYLAQTRAEVINGTAANNEIFADDETIYSRGMAGRVIEISLPSNVGVTTTQVTITGVPSGFKILNGTEIASGIYTIDIDPTTPNTFRMQVAYTIPREGTAIDSEGFYERSRFSLRLTYDGTSATGKKATIQSIVDIGVRDVHSESDSILHDSSTGQLLIGLSRDPTGNIINAGAGDDTIHAAAGADQIDGGEGLDTLIYDRSNSGVSVSLAEGKGDKGFARGDTIINVENVTGSDYSDTIIGDANSNILIGGIGADSLAGGGGQDTLIGGAGADTIDGANDLNSVVSYIASQEAVTVNLQTRINTGGDAEGDQLDNVVNIVASAFGDVITVGEGATSIYGGLGNDRIIVGMTHNSTLDGGDGFDDIDFSNTNQAISVSLQNLAGQNPDANNGNQFKNFENVTGSAFDDTISGDNNNNRLSGGEGNDLFIAPAELKNDTIDGQGGSDTVDYSLVTRAGISLTLSGSSASYVASQGSTKDQLVNIENVIGTNFKDTIIGDNGDNSLAGGDGADFLIGSDGNNTLSGGAGDDTVQGGSGTDSIDGNGGNNTINYSYLDPSRQHNLTVAGAVMVASTVATNNDGTYDVDYLLNVENLIGSDGDDIITGDQNNNSLFGGDGNDTFIVDGGGADTIDGGNGTADTLDFENFGSKISISIAGNLLTGTGLDGFRFTAIENVMGTRFDDTLLGGSDDNRLEGGAGNDLLIGAAGNDTLDGGDGIDTADYSYLQPNLKEGIKLFMDAGSDGVTFNGMRLLDKSPQSYDLDTLVNIEILNLSQGDDDVELGNATANLTIKGNGGADTIFGGQGDDLVDASASTAAVVLSGGAGRDTIKGGSTNTDRVDYSYLFDQGVTISAMNGSAGTYSASVNTYDYDQITNIEIFTGGSGNDSINMQYASLAIGLSLDGGAGDDTFVGSDQDDLIEGGMGNDVVDYSGSASALSIQSNGDDGTSYTVQNTNGSIGSDTVRNVETIILSRNGDYVELLNVTLNLSIDGGSGNDYIQLGQGDDTIRSGSGSNTIDGGQGNDLVIYDDITSNLSATYSNGSITVTRQNQRDTLFNIEEISSGSGNDNINVAGSGNALNTSNMTVIGGGGHDSIRTGAGNDSILTGSGNDRLDSGIGNDTLSGGDGNDIYILCDNNSFVTENENSGTDIIWAKGSEFNLSTNGSNVEGLLHKDSNGNILNTAFTGIGNALDNTIMGGTGDDCLVGGGGNDNFIWTGGNDFVDGAGDENADGTIDGISFARVRTNSEGAALSAYDHIEVQQDINGQWTVLITKTNGGNTVILNSIESIFGSAGNDYFAINNHDVNQIIDGSSGINTLDYSQLDSNHAVSLSLSANKALFTNGVSDNIKNFQNVIGTAGNDTFIGSDSDNMFTGNGGSDYIDGTGGNNTADYSYISASGLQGITATISASYTINDLDGAIDTLTNIENLIGSANADRLIGDDQANSLYGGDGNDSLAGGGGNDTLDGGAGSGDFVDFTYAGNQAVTITGNDLTWNAIVGANSDDSDILRNFEFIKLGSGISSVDLSGLTRGVTIDGSASANATILTGAGRDSVRGGQGDDCISGGGVSSSNVQDQAGDSLDGAGGMDTVSYAFLGQNNTQWAGYYFRLEISSNGNTASTIWNVSLYNSDNQLVATDTVSNFERIADGYGNDFYDIGDLTPANLSNFAVLDSHGSNTIREKGLPTIDLQNTNYGFFDDFAGITYYGNQNFYFRGKANAHTVIGNTGNDSIYGGSGSDCLVGGDGNDTIVGGGGNDTMDGGTGENTFGIYSAGNFVIHNSGTNGTLRAYFKRADNFTSIDLGNAAGIVNIELYYQNTPTGNYSAIGSSDSNLITGGANANDSANEYIDGREGNDTINANGGNDTVIGGTGNDCLDGGTGSDVLSYIYADGGVSLKFDSVDTSGITTLLGRSPVGTTFSSEMDIVTNFESIVGSNGNDTIDFSNVNVGVYIDVLNGANSAVGSGGNDTLISTGSDASNPINIFRGGLGNDSMGGVSSYGINFADYTYTSNNLTISLSNTGFTTVNVSQNDSDTLLNILGILGGSGNDCIVGNNGFNRFYGNVGDDSLIGGGGDDLLSGGIGSDSLDGGTGTDTADYSYVGDASGINASSGGGSLNTGISIALNTIYTTTVNVNANDVDIIKNIENIIGTKFGDSIIGDSASNSIFSGLGNDTIGINANAVASNADTLDGGDGIDTLFISGIVSGLSATIDLMAKTASFSGSSSASGYQIYNFENIVGGSGNDSLNGNNDANLFVGGNGADTIDGAGGIDTVSYTYLDAGINAVSVNLKSNQATVYSSDVDQIYNIENVIGTKNNDTIIGNASANVLFGGAGNDSLSGGSGNDTIDGGDGNDIVSYVWGNAADGLMITGETVTGTGTTFNVTGTLQSGSFADQLINIETLVLSDGLSSVDLQNASANLSLAAGAYNDTILGGMGNDTISGGTGTNSLSGGSGIDVLSYAFLNAGLNGISISLNGSTTATTGGAQTDTIVNFEYVLGSANNDTIFGDNQDNSVSGGLGNDLIAGGFGANTLDGNGGIDAVDYSYVGNGSLSISATSNTTWLASVSDNANGSVNDQISNFEMIKLGSASNTINLGSVTTALTVDGSAGGANTITTGSAADLIFVGSGFESIDGKAGTDIVDYSYLSTGIATITGLSSAFGTKLQIGNTDIDTLINIEQIRLGTAAYSLNLSAITSGLAINGANAGSLVVNGTSGSDSISGSGSNNDTFFSGAGNDTFDAGSTGSTNIYKDDVFILQNQNAISVTAIAGNFLKLVYNGDANDFDQLTNFRSIKLENSTTSLTTFDMSAVNSTSTYSYFMIDARDAGPVSLAGGGANDSFFGSRYSDTFNAGGGNNYIVGGDGDDLYYLNSSSATVTIIETATGGVDTIQTNLSTIDLGSNYANVENLIYTSGSAFSGAGNSLNNYIRGNSNADTLSGGGGNDTLDGSGGSFDTADYSYFTPLGVSGVTVQLSVGLNAGIAYGTGNAGSSDVDTLYNIERVTGSNYNDSLVGDDNANQLNGGLGADTLVGGFGNDTLIGGSSNDSSNGQDWVMYSYALGAITASLSGVGGNVSVAGGSAADNDVLANIENIIGGAYNDSISGDAMGNYFIGGDGADTFSGGAGNDSFDGNGTGAVQSSSYIDIASYAYLNSSAQSVSIRLNGSSWSTATVTNSASGQDVDNLINIEGVIGSAGSDTIIGDNFVNSLFGGSGNDCFGASTGNDLIDGGAGNDIVDYSFVSGATETFSIPAAGTITVTKTVAGQSSTDTLINIESISGLQLAGGSATTGASVNFSSVSINIGMIGTTYADTIIGGAGNDTIRGAFGNDTIDGGLGGRDLIDYSYVTSGISVNLNGTTSSLVTIGIGDIDTLVNIEGVISSGGNDTITLNGTAGYYFVNAAGGNDSVINALGSFQTYDGGLGTDTLSFANISGAVGVSMNISTGAWASWFGNAISTYANNSAVNFEYISGSANADIFTGDYNANSIFGASGNDTLVSGGGNDCFDGGDGSDVIDLSFVTSGISLSVYQKTNLGLPIASTYTAPSGAVISFINFEGIIGGSGDDSLSAIDPQNSNNSNLTGGYFFGAAGNDTIIGGSGADTIAGGVGNDSLTGGSGIDTADYSYLASGTISLSNVTSSLMTMTVTNAGITVETDTLSGFENVSLGTSNAVASINLTGLGTAFNLSLGNGADTVVMGSGADAVNSFGLNNNGSNSDTADGGAGSDSLNGGSNNYNLALPLTRVVMSGTQGSYTVLQGTGSGLTLPAQGLTSTFVNFEAIYAASTGAVSDTMIGSSSSSTIRFYGNAGGDFLDDGTGANMTLDGGLGNDTFFLRSGSTSIVDTFSTGNGNINQIFSSLSSVDLSGTQAQTGSNLISNIVYIANDTNSGYNTTTNSWANYDSTTNSWSTSGLGSGNFTGIGNDQSNIIVSGGGNDCLVGGVGADTLIGNGGHDVLYGGMSTSPFDRNVLSGLTALNSMAKTYSSLVSTTGVTAPAGLTGYSIYNLSTDTTANVWHGVNQNITNQVGGSAIYKIQLYIKAGPTTSTSATAVQIGFTDSQLGFDDTYLIYDISQHRIVKAVGAIQSYTVDTDANGWYKLTFYSSARQLSQMGNSGSTSYYINALETNNYSSVTKQYAYTGTGKTAQLTGISVDALDGADSLSGGAGNDTLYGGNGGDTLSGGVGNDILDGNGNGVDVADYSYATTGLTVTLNGTTTALSVAVAAGDVDTLYNIEGIIGSSTAANSLTGDALANYLMGGSASDTIYGMDGNDTIDGGNGGAGSLDGGIGTDILSFASYGNGVSVGLANTSYSYNSQVTNFTNFEGVIGSSFNDSIGGDTGANYLYGMNGLDSLAGGLGADTLQGGFGNDVLDGGDTSSINIADYSYTTSAITTTLNTTASFTVNAGANDVDTLTNIEGIIGGSGNDLITGDSFANYLDGSIGNDTLVGKGGADTLVGGMGNDLFTMDWSSINLSARVDGGVGSDTVNFAGSSGSSTLTGSSFGTILSNVEYLDFSGTSGSVNLSLNGDDVQKILMGSASSTMNAGILDIKLETGDVFSLTANASYSYWNSNNTQTVAISSNLNSALTTIGSDILVYDNTHSTLLATIHYHI